MPRPRTTTVRDLRKSNRSRALWEVFLNGPLTRQEVGTVAGLSPATVSNLVAALAAEGVLAEVGLQDSNGGRPRGLLQVNPDYGSVIGVDVGETAFLVELFDFALQRRAAAPDPRGGRAPGAAAPVQPGRDRQGRTGPGRGRAGRSHAAHRPVAQRGRDEIRGPGYPVPGAARGLPRLTRRSIPAVAPGRGPRHRPRRTPAPPGSIRNRHSPSRRWQSRLRLSRRVSIIPLLG